MIRVNHSCAPNVGMGGNVLLVAMREIAAGEELTIDYALFLGDPGFSMDCRCRTAACRGVVRGGGLDARRFAGALPGMVFLVAPAEDRANPGPPGPVAHDEERWTGRSARSAADETPQRWAMRNRSGPQGQRIGLTLRAGSRGLE